MVSFIENPESYDSQMMVLHLDKQLEECMALEKKLSAFDKQLSLEPRYIHRVKTLHGVWRYRVENIFSRVTS